MSVDTNDDRPVDLARLIMLAAAFAVVVSVILIGAFLAYGWFTQRGASETRAPICYWADEANYTPRNDPIPLRGAPGYRGERSADQRNDQTSEEKLTEAENACKIGACPREGFATYRSAIFWYLSPRLQHTRRLDQAHGQVGLRRASEIYNEPFDRRVEQGLRDRHKAGVFRFKDFTQNREAVAILVLKGGQALRPCRKGDV
jgi:hypothetical protein